MNIDAHEEWDESDDFLLWLELAPWEELRALRAALEQRFVFDELDDLDAPMTADFGRED